MSPLSPAPVADDDPLARHVPPQSLDQIDRGVLAPPPVRALQANLRQDPKILV
jgi:hypothetical protein